MFKVNSTVLSWIEREELISSPLFSISIEQKIVSQEMMKGLIDASKGLIEVVSKCEQGRFVGSPETMTNFFKAYLAVREVLLKNVEVVGWKQSLEQKKSVEELEKFIKLVDGVNLGEI